MQVCCKYVKFKNKVELYEPLYLLLIWITFFVFELHTAISDIIDMEFGKRVEVLKTRSD
jgi:hypothetical protein